MKRGVLFDLDGVLVSSYDTWYRLLDAAARDLGYGPIEAEAFAESWGQALDEDVRRFFPGHRPEEVERYCRSHFRLYSRHMAVHPDARGILHALRGAGVGTAVVTNTPGTLAREILEAAELRADTVVGAGDIARPKPAPDMLWRACEHLGVRPKDAWMVGDSRFDREAAKAAGISFAGFGIAGDATLDELRAIVPLALGNEGW